MTPPGRNSPCPCGSGKRYKDCHGALGATVDSLAAPAGDVVIGQRMGAALAAQQAGRYAEARELYEGVIAQYPRNFDAVHMLGVVHYQLGELERAHELVSAALAIRPAYAGARVNLGLIETALELPMIEPEICAETLPRFANRCIAPPAPGDRRRWRDTRLDLIVSKTEMRDGWIELERLMHWLGAAGALWLYRDTPPAASRLKFRTIDPEADAFPQDRVALFYGAEISPAAWYPRALATEVLLYCDAYDPRTLVDRIPELAREGRTPLRLLFASPRLADRACLPGWVVDASDAGGDR